MCRRGDNCFSTIYTRRPFQKTRCSASSGERVFRGFTAAVLIAGFCRVSPGRVFLTERETKAPMEDRQRTPKASSSHEDTEGSASFGGVTLCELLPRHICIYLFCGTETDACSNSVDFYLASLLAY